MNGTEARAGEHDDRQLRHHRHVNRNAVAFFDAQRFQDVRELADFLVQLFVGERLHVIFRLALPDDGGFGARGGLEVTVEAIDAHIELAVLEPGVLNLPRGGVPDESASERGLPGPLERAGLFQPERIRCVYRTFVHRFVLVGVEVGAFDHLERWRKSPLLLQE